MYTVGKINQLTVRHEWKPGPIDTVARVCHCVGPKNGQPLCPCAMRGVEIRDGHYVRVQDLGPVVDDWYFESREGWGGLG